MMEAQSGGGSMVAATAGRSRVRVGEIRCELCWSPKQQLLRVVGDAIEGEGTVPQNKILNKWTSPVHLYQVTYCIRVEGTLPACI